jgi:hypothetical protein
VTRWWLKPIVGLVLLAVILLTAPIYGRLTSDGKISPEVDRNATKVEVTVDLPFEPENYHRETLSELGVFGGRDREDLTLVRLRSVSQSDLEKIANLFWVDEIYPTPDR